MLPPTIFQEPKEPVCQKSTAISHHGCGTLLMEILGNCCLVGKSFNIVVWLEVTMLYGSCAFPKHCFVNLQRGAGVNIYLDLPWSKNRKVQIVVLSLLLVQCCLKWSWCLPPIVCKVIPSVCLQPHGLAFQWERSRRAVEVSLYQPKQEPDWIKQRKTNPEPCEWSGPGSAGTHLDTAWEKEGALLGKTGGKHCLTLWAFWWSWRRHFVLSDQGRMRGRLLKGEFVTESRLTVADV